MKQRPGEHRDQQQSQAALVAEMVYRQSWGFELTHPGSFCWTRGQGHRETGTFLVKKLEQVPCHKVSKAVSSIVLWGDG